MRMTRRLPNAANGRRRHYWHVFSRDRGDPASWVHEIGFDNVADARAEQDDIRDHGRVPRIIPCLWTDEPEAMVRALNETAKRQGPGAPKPLTQDVGEIIRLVEAASARGRT